MKEKPPLGVVPKYVWDELRKADLAATIKRALDAGTKVLPDWIYEYNSLAK